MPEKEFTYKRKYISSDGEIKTYPQTIKKEVKDTDLKIYINNITITANRKVTEINRLERLLKTIIRYRGYNKKNLYNRFYRLEHADEITTQEKKIVKDIMGRQKIIADDLVTLLKYILDLYGTYDVEIKEITKKLEEFDKK